MYEGEKEVREGWSCYIRSEALLPIILLSKVERYGSDGQVRARLGTGRRPATTCSEAHILHTSATERVEYV